VEGQGIQHFFIHVLTRDARLDLAPQFQAGPARYYPAKFEHRAPPGRTITGVVREKGTGKPLAGVWVAGGGTLSRGRTDEKGRYELTGCAKAKEYYVEADLEDGVHFRGVVAVADTAGLGPLPAADLELMRGIPFRGKVIDKGTGKPVRGVAEYLPLWPNADGIKAAGAFRYGHFTRATIKEDGTFSCAVLPGPGAVTVRAEEGDYVAPSVDPQAFFKDKLGAGARLTGNRQLLWRVVALGYTPQAQPTDQDEFHAIALVHPDKDTKEIRQEIALEPARHLKVSVTGADGKPLAGARVRGRKQAYNWDAVTGADFTMPGPNPQRPRTLLLLHEGKRLIGTLTVKGDEKGPLEVRLEPWGTVTGRLVNADGEAYANCPVFPQAAKPSPQYPPQAQTDKDGNFRVEGMIPGVKYGLGYWEAKGNRIVATGTIAKDLTLKAGETRDLGRVTGRLDGGR
jgi:hypothetical protein